MRFPHDNFESDYNTTAGYSYGDITSYGFHEGVDVNDNFGGDSDLGKPIYCVADGIVTSVHTHTTKPTFGNHFHYLIKGVWGERYIHHAHCQEIYVSIDQEIKEGQLIARIGKSGTGWAHDHWAIKKQPTGIDAIAKTKTDLEKWENPVEFVQKYIKSGIIPPIPPMNNQTIIPAALNGLGEDLEIQAIKGKLLDGVRDAVDLESNKRQVAQLQIINDQQAQLLATKDKLIRQLQDQVLELSKQPEKPPLPPVSDGYTPPLETVQFPLFLRQLLDALKRWFK